MAAVEERSRSNDVAHIGLSGFVPAMLHRPDGVLQRARWVFTWYALLALLFNVPGILPSVSASPLALTLATTAALCLTGSLIYGFLRERVPIALEIIDAVALTAFALATPVPLAATPLILAFAWQRTLYGSSWRAAVLRGGLYTGAVLAISVLWAVTPEHATDVAVARQLATVSIMLLTIAVSAQLRSGLKAHDWAIERDKVLTETGANLLGLTDGVEIRTLAWRTAATLGSATPGLRVLKVGGGSGQLTVSLQTGHFDTPLATLPLDVLEPSGPNRPARIVNQAPLDAATGSVLAWECIPLAEQTENGWLLVGAPQRIPEGTLRSVRSLVNQVNLALRTSDAHRQLLVAAQYDGLTGLDNRLSFTAQLGAELARADASGLHVLFLDLDDFKNINDQMGHRAGDTVLTEVADRLRRCIRPQDICARLGGDEFAVVLTGTSDATTAAIAERMVESLATPFMVNGQPCLVGASVGVASHAPGVDIDDLVHQADVAMYAAKAQGKGRVQVFQPGLLQAETPAMAFERQLGRAAGSGELVVHYQPIVTLADLTCTGAEALVRWQHPERGLLLPGEFISLAETTGAILSIGAFMLRRSCADAATWPEARPGVPMTVHVNLSARELESNHFVDSVLWCLADSGLPANRLVLELTETVVLESVDAVQRLKTLAAHGIHIAIDDFGTGYSSLSTLRMLPITVVKLDSSFVAGALSSPVDRSVVEAIVQMAGKLGITTVAEGVERRDQQELLRQIGTDQAQGYLYGRPAPLDELLAWLATPREAQPALAG